MNTRGASINHNYIQISDYSFTSSFTLVFTSKDEILLKKIIKQFNCGIRMSINRRDYNSDNYLYALLYRERLFNFRPKLVTYIESAFDILQKILIDEIDTRKIQQGDEETDRKSTRLNSSHGGISRMPSSA